MRAEPAAARSFLAAHLTRVSDEMIQLLYGILAGLREARQAASAARLSCPHYPPGTLIIQFNDRENKYKEYVIANGFFEYLHLAV